MPMHEMKEIYYEDFYAISMMQKYLLEYAKVIKQERNLDKFDDIVILCIGTDRLPGDCLGPLVGSLLLEKGETHAHVYGTMEAPLHAKNMESILANIDSTFNPHTTLKIAIDASLSSTIDIGTITIKNDGLQPGSGAGKDLPLVGDISIAGIVNSAGGLSFVTLQNTRMSLIWSMSRTIREGIYHMIYNINEIRRNNDAKKY